MRLKHKLLWAMVLACSAMLLITYGISELFLVKSFQDLERSYVLDNVDRSEQALGQVIERTASFTSDWGHWDDARSFVAGKNPAFAPHNMLYDSLVTSNLDAIVYSDLKGHIMSGIYRDRLNNKLGDPPAGLLAAMQDPAMIENDKEGSKSGYLKLPSGIYLYGSSGVTDGAKKLPIAGHLFVTHQLNEEMINKVEETTKLDVNIFPLPLAPADQTFKEIVASLTQENNLSSRLIKIQDDNHVMGFSLLRDAHHSPIALMQVIMPRKIYQVGTHAIDYYLATFLLVGLALTALIWLLLQRVIVSRLENLNKGIEEIEQQSDLQHRVTISGKDEMASLANKFNHMMDIIAQSHNELELRVAERTKALQTSNEKLNQEIVERKEIEKELLSRKQELLQLAHFDSLTGLNNRFYFEELSNEKLQIPRQGSEKLALLFIDIDRFKHINDAFGHQIGDRVLIELSSRIAQSARKQDVLGRLGGDEFVLLLSNLSNRDEALAVAQNILQACRRPVFVDEHEFNFSACIGIAVCPDDAEDLETLKKYADMAMYEAKSSNGNLCLVYSNEMNAKAQKLVRIEKCLRKALEKNELSLHYQPKVELVTKKITGVEALLRWHSSELGFVSPADFISIAEETGLIVAIGEWVIREACTALKRWRGMGYKLDLSVNLSLRQFSDENLISKIEKIISDTKISAADLEIEITESVLMDDANLAVEKLHALRTLGVRIAIDDFGTGYSSISYLREFPIQVLKIDQSFVRQLPEDSNSKAIVAAVIALAQELGLHTVAEGIETKRQYEFLLDCECETGQGYLFAKPMPESDLNKILAEQFTNATEQESE